MQWNFWNLFRLTIYQRRGGRCDVWTIIITMLVLSWAKLWYYHYGIWTWHCEIRPNFHLLIPAKLSRNFQEILLLLHWTMHCTPHHALYCTLYCTLHCNVLHSIMHIALHCTVLHSVMHTALPTIVHSTLHTLLHTSLQTQLHTALHTALQTSLQNTLHTALQNTLHTTLHWTASSLKMIKPWSGVKEGRTTKLY